MESLKNIGLVLSGGGHRGVAHIGAIKALREFGIVPDIVSGVSSGALVAALYAADYSEGAMLECFKKVKIFSFTRYARKKPGFVNTDSFRDFLLDYFPQDNYESLSKKLYVTATDLTTGKAKVFSKGALISTLLASASFPGVFTPVKIEGSLYSDGGIIDNFPVRPIQNICDEIYGVYVSPVRPKKITDFKHAYNVIERAYYLMVHSNSSNEFAHCDLLIYPNLLSKYNTFNSNHVDDIFEIGYNETKKKLEEYLLASVKD